MKLDSKSLFGAVALVVSAHAGGARAQVNLSAEAASPGGSSYVTTLQLAEVAKNAGIADIQITEGQTLTNSVQNVAEGTTDYAPAPFIIPFLLSKGLGPYSALGEEKGKELAGNLRLLYPYVFGIYAFYAYETSPVKGWDTIPGHRILNGPPGGAAVNTTRGLVKIVAGLDDGKDYEGVQVNWGQATETFMQGTVDAAISPELFPSPRLTQASSAGTVDLFSIPKDVFEAEATQRFLGAPGSAPYEMPVESVNFSASVKFISEDANFRGLAAVGGGVVNKNMDEELAYQLTRAFIASIPDLKRKVPFGGMIGLGELDATKSGMCGANPLKYHPGAVRAWTEAGLNVPDCAK